MQTGAGGGWHVLTAIEQVNPYAHSPAMVVTHPCPMASLGLQVGVAVLVSQ